MRILFLIALLLAGGCGAPLYALPHLLPLPQKVEWNGQKFMLKEVAVQSPVLGGEVEDWIVENGGSVNGKAKRVIEIRLTDHIEGMGLNEEEG